MKPRIIEIRRALEGLVKDLPEVEACLIAKSGLEGVIMFPDSFRNEASQVWGPMSEVLESVLDMIERFTGYPLETVLVQSWAVSTISVVPPFLRMLAPSPTVRE